jgi:hypothetical protein
MRSTLLRPISPARLRKISEASLAMPTSGRAVFARAAVQLGSAKFA